MGKKLNGIWAKPIVDILVEIAPDEDILRLETDKALQCDQYFLCSITQQKKIGTAEYHKVMQSIEPDKLSRYDANHVLIEGLTLEEMEAVFQKAAE